MIWVRAIGVFGHASIQVGEIVLFVPRHAVTNLPLQTPNGNLENVSGGSIAGSDQIRLPTIIPNPPQPIIGPTPIGGATTTHPATVMPITFPAIHCGACGAIEVPQRQYRSAPLSPDPTYDRGEFIAFSKGGGCGVPIVEASEYQLSDLLGGEDLMFVDTAVSTFSVRIEVRMFAVSMIHMELTKVSV